MSFKFRFFFLPFLIIFLPLSADSRKTNKEIVNILKKSTVNVQIRNDDDELIGTGSGVIIKYENNIIYVLTNAHVVEDHDADGNPIDFPEQYAIYVVPEYSRWSQAEDAVQDLLVTDYLVWSGLDIAVLKVDLNELVTSEGKSVIGNSTLPDISPIKLGSTLNLSELDQVYAAGYPYVIGNQKEYLDIFITQSEINSFILEDGWDQTEGYSIVYRLGVQGGMSGGPVVNANGELIAINGISESSYSTSQGQGGSKKSWGLVFAAGYKFLDLLLGYTFDSAIDTVKDEVLVPERATYDYGIDIADFIILALIDEEDNLNPKSIFYSYLPKINKRLEDDLLSSWNQNEWIIPGYGNKEEYDKNQKELAIKLKEKGKSLDELSEVERRSILSPSLE